MVKFGQTDSGKNVNVRVFGGTDKVNSVGPMCKGQSKTSTRFDRLHKLGETDFGNKQTENWSSKLGEIDDMNSVGPISVIGNERICKHISVRLRSHR